MPSIDRTPTDSLREAFVLWLDSFDWGYPDITTLSEDNRSAFAGLWSCERAMPADCCRQLKLSVGTSYATAVRRLFAEANQDPQIGADLQAEAA